MQSHVIPDRQFCPQCGSGEVHKTVFYGLVERCILYLWGLTPFQCRCCCKRFYRRIVLQGNFHEKSSLT